MKSESDGVVEARPTHQEQTMPFEYRDAYGRILTADHGLDDDDNPMAVLWARGEFGASVPVRVPARHVEEVVAGIRDAARLNPITEEQP